jgi:hypothetical protein|nr:MAG TPA: hypothetical protein [Caudoviricetes sp.]
MAFSIILLENLTELKTRRGNASSTTIASILGLNYPTTEGFSFYKWDDTSTTTGDDDEIVHPTVGGGLSGRWFKIDILITAQLVIAALGYPPYDANNPDGFISSYIETDPTVPSFAKTLVSFAIIKALTDPLYKPIGYTPTSSEITTALGFTPTTNTRTLTINGISFDLSANRTWTVGDVTTTTLTSGLATKENTITAGTTAQYWRGDKTWQTLDKIAVGLGNIDNTADVNKNVLSATKLTTARNINGVAFDGTSNITIVDATKEPIITAGTNLQYWRGDKTWQTLNTANVPENTNLYYTNSRARASISLTTTGTGTSTYNSTTGILNIPTPVTTTDNTVTRTINSSTYTISSTKPATVKYNIKIACTATIGSASSGKVLFQYSTDGGTNWIDAGEVENSNTVSLAIVLNSTTNQSGFIVWSVPANALCRLVPTTSGTTTITWIRGQETY